MEDYTLTSDEVLLFEENVSWEGKWGTSHLLLTNKAIVFKRKFREGKAFHKTWTHTVDVFPLENIKWFNDSPQITQKKDVVNIQTTLGNIGIEFDDIKESKKFFGKLLETTTGSATFERGAGKVKGAIGVINDTLGVDTIETVKGIMENGVIGTVLGGIKGKREDEKQSIVSDAVGVAHELLENKAGQSTTVEEKGNSKKLSYDQQIDAVKKMKDLLDAGILTQEEFDKKKKEILGL